MKNPVQLLTLIFIILLACSARNISFGEESGKDSSGLQKNYKYLPVPGKKIIIRTAYPSPGEYHHLSSQLGITGLIVYDTVQVNQALSNGFKKDQLVAAIDRRDGFYPEGEFNSYYLDEPLENDLTEEDVIKLADKISALNKSASLYICSYKDYDDVVSGYQEILAKTANTFMMCDQYYDGLIFCGHSQENWWVNFKEWYPRRAPAHWVHLLVDGIQNDFDMLFKKANDLGVNSLWIYSGDAEGGWIFEIREKLDKEKYNMYLSEFMEAALRNGWVIKEEVN